MEVELTLKAEEIESLLDCIQEALDVWVESEPGDLGFQHHQELLALQHKLMKVRTRSHRSLNPIR